MLADAVATPPDGKIYMQGGGITRLTPAALPLIIPSLGVLVRLAATEAETAEHHVLEFAWTDPDGQRVQPVLMGAMDPGSVEPLAPGEERYLTVAFNTHGLRFEKAGPYGFSLRVDDQPMGSIALAVIEPQG
jgi:hypothetical protein